MTPEQTETMKRLRLVSESTEDKDSWNRERVCEMIRTQASGWRDEVKQLLAETEPVASTAESEHISRPAFRIFEKYLAKGSRPQDDLVSTGFPDLDRLMSLEAGSLVVVGARSGRGKSSISMQFAFNVAEVHGASLFFSSEMPSDQLALRLVCSLAKVDSKRVRRGTISDDVEYPKLIAAANRVKACMSWISDRAGLDALTIRDISRREVKRIEQESGRCVRLIVVDYLQRIRAGKAAPHGSNREQQVAAVAQEMKEMARELGVCVVVPAQLNADADKRYDDRPRTSDLRESKGIENEADAVLLVHNPGYVARTENEDANLAVPEVCELILGKGRSDGNGMTSVWFTPMYSRFDSMSDADKLEQRAIRERAKTKAEASKVRGGKR